MTLLITGKNGQVGHELRRALSVVDDIVAVDADECDLRDENAIRQLIARVRPSHIVHPAAYTAVDKAEDERESAFAINARAPEILAEEAQKWGAMMVYYSTDYVFDGEQTSPYTESDSPRPQSVYGDSKWLGERAVAQQCARHLILRTSWVVGAHGQNFAKTMIRLASERDSLRVVADQYGTPTSAALLADITAHLLRQEKINPSNFPYGLYHATAMGDTNWHEYAVYVIERARALGCPIRVAPTNILAISNEDYPTRARRPRSSRLSTQKLRTNFNLHLPSWQESLAPLIEFLMP